jgi:hypothetical protein
MCFDSSPSGYAEPAESFVFPSQPSALQSPISIDPASALGNFSGYDACTSPLESSWSRSTATTPSDDALAGYLAIPAGACYGAASLSPVAVGGTEWAGTFVHFGATHSGPPSVGHANSMQFAHPHAVSGCQVVMHETLQPESESQTEEESWDECAVRSTATETNAKKDAGAKETSNTQLAAPPRGKKSKGRKSSAKKELAGPALRTAARKHKRTEPTSKPGESAQAHRARASHNQVEKEYRNRLHGYFERLLNVLPDEDELNDEARVRQSPSGSASCGSSQNKRLSKAEVLQKARQHIVFLEEDVAKRRREIRALKRASSYDLDR